MSNFSSVVLRFVLRFVLIGTVMLATPFTTGATPPPVVVAPTAPVSALVDGEIRKIDKDSGKVTIKHAQIKSLDMPAMTMVFLFKDPSKIDSLKVGDKIKFDAVDEKGKMFVTKIEVVK